MSAPWKYNETPEFVSSAAKLGLTEEYREFLRNWAVSVNQTPTPRLKGVFYEPKRVFQIWVAGLPRPDANKGKSGGYRLYYFLVLRDNAIHLDRIYERDDIGFRGEGQKKKHDADEYLEELKQHLLKSLC